MNTPTRTTNKLHFEDLEPHRFEDMGYELLYRLQNWNCIVNWGRSGSDDGIDIYCEDSKRQKWFCQCKRYKKIAQEQVRSVVENKYAKEHFSQLNEELKSKGAKQFYLFQFLVTNKFCRLV